MDKEIAEKVMGWRGVVIQRTALTLLGKNT